jgi:hypothetical protein
MGFTCFAKKWPWGRKRQQQDLDLHGLDDTSGLIFPDLVKFEDDDPEDDDLPEYNLFELELEDEDKNEDPFDNDLTRSLLPEYNSFESQVEDKVEFEDNNPKKMT